MLASDPLLLPTWLNYFLTLARGLASGLSVLIGFLINVVIAYGIGYYLKRRAELRISQYATSVVGIYVILVVAFILQLHLHLAAAGWN
jgi:hypothetical protein